MKDARIVWHNGSPAIACDGEIYPPMAATLLRHDRDYYAHLRQAGIRVFFLTCTTDWLCPHALESLEHTARTLLEAVPDAKCFLRLSLDPPLAWLQEHPDEWMRYDDGSTEPFAFHSEFLNGSLPAMYFLGSAVWREEAGRHLLRFLDALDRTPLAEHIIGYFLAAGVCSEWNAGNPLNLWPKHKGAGYSPAFRRTFSRYLRETYGTEEQLRAAWRDPSATFADPPIPSMEERYFTNIDTYVMDQFEEFSPGKADPANGTNCGSFLDMDRHAYVMDFLRAFHYGPADSIVYMAKLLKDRDDHKMVGAFYGGYGCTDYINCGSAGCTLKVLDCGAVDYLATPGTYNDRQLGGVTAQRAMQDSFRLRGRLFISEEDTRTHCDGDFYRETMHLYTMEDSANILKRDFGRNICEDIYGWWFDHAASGKRYQDEGIYRLFARQQEIAAFAYGLDRRKHNEVALLYDEESISLVSQQTSYELCDLFRTSEGHRLGLPVDYYFHDDLARDDMPDYKVYVFLNAFYLNDRDREAITRKIKAKGRMAIWMYASGFINPDALQRNHADNITALTGIRTVMDPHCAFTHFRVEGDHPALRGVDRDRIYGCFDRRIVSNVWLRQTSQTTYAYPLFYTADPEAQVLGRFCNSGRPALTIKESDGFVSVFCGAKILRADLLQALARYAGCHVWSDNTDDILYTDGRFLVLHAAATGERTLRFPREADAFEVYEKRFYGRHTREITVPVRFGETKMFSLCGVC